MILYTGDHGQLTLLISGHCTNSDMQKKRNFHKIFLASLRSNLLSETVNEELARGNWRMTSSAHFIIPDLSKEYFKK